MRTLTLAFLLATATVAQAQYRLPQTIPYKDEVTKETIGTATFDGNRIYLRKTDGELIGTVVTDFDGKRTMYDPSGKEIEITVAPAGKPNAR